MDLLGGTTEKRSGDADEATVGSVPSTDLTTKG